MAPGISKLRLRKRLKRLESPLKSYEIYTKILGINCELFEGKLSEHEGRRHEKPLYCFNAFLGSLFVRR